MNSTQFSSLSLKPELLQNVESLGYQEMTPIQAQSLPAILAGKDVIGQGKTGSGKTATFGLGVLQNLNVKRFRIQALILCPTRELADQVAQDIRTLARTIHNIKVLTLCGGMPFGPQVGSLEHGAHIVVGTPGRIEEHLRKGKLKLAEVNTFVLDEADRMLDMGFEDKLNEIAEYLPAERQTLLFSATYPEQIKQISQRFMQQPTMVQVTGGHSNSSIAQSFYKVADDNQRLTGVQLLLQKFKPQSAVVFCNTKRAVQGVAEALADAGFSVLALHGDLEQRDRDQALLRFANKSACVLVATDVAARGLDVDGLDAVINYDVAHDPEVHTHRIGRTGRAGGKGIACTMYSQSEAHRVAMIESDVDPINNAQQLPPLTLLGDKPLKANMVTLQIEAGKRQKIRPGDILGALTGENGIAGSEVGKIKIADNWAFVAVTLSAKRAALDKLNNGQLKGRSYRVRAL